MHIPQYWAQARLRHATGQRHGATVQRWGWSDHSQQEAQNHAQQRAQQALDAVLAAPMQRQLDAGFERMEWRTEYGLEGGTPIREEVLERRDESVMTRNSYGAHCLNTENVAIADIDTRRLTRILRVKGAQAGAILTGADATEEKAQALIAEFGSMVGKDLAKEVSPGERHGFYCQITSVDKSSAVLSGCLPLRQFASLKRKQIEALIHRYLAGEKVLDPNLPTYAMMAYMAVVSARLLPRDSVCRRTVEDEIIFTDADRRLCNQEVADLWQRADSNPKFDKTMDNVVEELTKHGVDVSMINQAASSLD